MFQSSWGLLQKRGANAKKYEPGISYRRIEALMKERGLTAMDVTRGAGLASAAQMTHWKQGKSNPGIKSLRKLSKFFQVPASYFLE